MKEKWFRTTDLVDEKYLLEADPGLDQARKKKFRTALAVMAAAACLALVLSGVWLFRPYSTVPPSVKAYKNSEYYPVIEKLSVMTWEKPKYKNNFDMLTSEFSDFFLAASKDAMANGEMEWIDDEVDGMAPGATAGGIYEGVFDTGTTDGTYEEITDNQVAGVTEADRIKRTDKHIYYLDENTLRVFSIDGANSRELCAEILLNNTKNYYVNQWEMYLSPDGKTVTVMAMYGKRTPTVCVLSLDVSDHTNIVEKNRLEITGNYLSSRVTDGKLLLMTQFVFNKNTMDFDKEETFLPQVNGESMAISNIIVPDQANNTRYTVVMVLDENTLTMEGQAAFLSYSEDVYVSQAHIYLAHVFADVQETENDYSIRNSMTEITCLSYKDGFEKKGSVTVRGYVKDQWSMDEYEGIFRVVTTTNATTMRENIYGDRVSAEVLVTATGNSNASLYCIDTKNFEIVASVEDFAPPHEEVQSVRFDGNTAYVCTSIEMSDPVFFFDLSNLEKITYKETGTIEGFSTSLVDFGNGYLLGIGREDWDTFKAEIYTETETGVEGFCSYTAKASYSTEYKSYYIDRENQLIGLGLTMQKGGVSRYVVLRFDGYNLIEVANVELAGNNNYKRGVYIDGFMYMFGENDFKVEKLFENNKQTESVFSTENISKITFYAYYGQGKGSVVPAENMTEMINWLNSITIARDATDEDVLPGTNTYHVEIEYADGTIIKEGLDVIVVDGTRYLLQKDKYPDCFAEIISKTSL